MKPKTAQKAVAELVRPGLLEVKPRVGTVVADWGPASAAEREGGGVSRAEAAGPVERSLVASQVGADRNALAPVIQAHRPSLCLDARGR